MKLCYEIFHNIFITFCTVRKNVGEKHRETAKNINFDAIKVKCMTFFQSLDFFTFSLTCEEKFRISELELRNFKVSSE